MQRLHLQHRSSFVRRLLYERIAGILCRAIKANQRRTRTEGGTIKGNDRTKTGALTGVRQIDK